MCVNNLCTLYLYIIYIYLHVQSVPEKCDTIEIYLIVLKPLLNARDYTPGNLIKLYLHLRILNVFASSKYFNARVKKNEYTNKRFAFYFIRNNY